MSDKVKVIIEIPKKVFEARKIGEISPWVTVPILDAVQEGIPLPKGYGRLIDADELENHLKEDADEWDEYALARVEDAPTVIGKESEG